MKRIIARILCVFGIHRMQGMGYLAPAYPADPIPFWYRCDSCGHCHVRK